MNTPSITPPSSCSREVREHTLTTTQPEIFGDQEPEFFGEQISTQHDSLCLSGQRESEPIDSDIGNVLNALLPSYKEVLEPTPLPTYQGATLHNRPDVDHLLRSAETPSTSLGKEYTWSRGHGFKHSPIKTRSARRKEGTTTSHSGDTQHNPTDIGALRGMKSLAREKP
jgi:hypothetical protein